MIDNGYFLDMGDGVSLREAVYRALRKAILTGELAPQERLMEIPLSEKLGVSRTPVREAIKRLAEEKLVILQPRCGAKVADITEKNVTDALWVQSAMEEMSVRLAAKNQASEQIAALRGINAEIAQAVRKKDINLIFDADNRFHRMICEAADNQVLMRVMRFLEELVLRYRMEYIKCIEDCGQILSEHEALINALEAGDEEKAAEVIKHHIENQAAEIVAKIHMDV